MVIPLMFFTVMYSPALISQPPAIGEMQINLKVGLFGTDHHLMYLIGGSTPLEYLVLDYADRTSLFYENTKFRYNAENGWCHVDPKKTADVLEMEDGDVIYSFTDFRIL
ncbi:hypothetical protein J1N35_036895 [Gossypium stocksii]|uniref:TF-B3 domain-containing protein n=1 Tax=Gossypium stocksii TaxID=47602 RepID=A0A9D3ZKD5_9ROSI|nr:hypothetical protein J1N35_036895 [Gossypium stocksii]